MRRSFVLVLATLCATGCSVEATADEPVATEEEALRREDFGQSKSLSVVDADGSVHAAPSMWSQNTYSTNAAFLLANSVSSVRELHWVGDANTYIDVFDNVLALNGTSMFPSSVARFNYPFASNSQTTSLGFCLPYGGGCTSSITSPTAVKLDLRSVFGSRAARAFRIYSRGECSGEAPWSEVVSSIGTGIATEMGKPLVSITGTPIVGVSSSGWSSDKLQIRSSYDIGTCSGRAYIDFRGSFVASEGRPAFRLESTSLRTSVDFGDDFCAGWATFAKYGTFDATVLQNAIADEIKTALSTQLAPAISAALVRRVATVPGGINVSCTTDDACVAPIQNLFRVGGFDTAANVTTVRNVACLPRTDGRTGNVCNFVPSVPRVNTRADALEIVVADSRNDGFIEPLRAAGACNRPEPAAGPAIGFGPQPNPTPPRMITVASVTSP